MKFLPLILMTRVLSRNFNALGKLMHNVYSRASCKLRSMNWHCRGNCHAGCGLMGVYSCDVWGQSNRQHNCARVWGQLKKIYQHANALALGSSVRISVEARMITLCYLAQVLQLVISPPQKDSKHVRRTNIYLSFQSLLSLNIPLASRSIISAFCSHGVLSISHDSYNKQRFGLLPCEVGFVADIIALTKVFYQYFAFPCQFSFRRMLHTDKSSITRGGGVIGQLMAGVPSGFSLTPLQAALIE
jgi:hypothetical protein